MKRLLSYMCAYKKESILGPLFKMLEASFELFVPLVVANMVDVGIANGSVSYVVRMGGLLLLLAIIGLTCSLTAQYFAAKAATGTATALRNNLFSHIGTLSYTEIDTIGTSTLITRMTSDINQLQNGVNMALRLMLRSPFVVFGAMVMAFTGQTEKFPFAVCLIEIPFSFSAASCAPRARKVTSWPSAARKAPMLPPVAPEPAMTYFKSILLSPNLSYIIHLCAHAAEKSIRQHKGCHGLYDHHGSRYNHRVVPSMYTDFYVFSGLIDRMLLCRD